MKKVLDKNYVPQFVYGGIDGAITTLAVMAGSMGASLSSAIILVLGFANLVADGFSMGVSQYLSAKSEGDLHRNHKDAKHYNRKASNAKKQGAATFVSFVIIGFIPLFPFVLSLFKPSVVEYQFTLSIILTGVALAIVGWVKGSIVRRDRVKSAIQTLLIGGVAAAVAFIIGYLLRGLVA